MPSLISAIAFSLPVALCCMSIHVSLRMLRFPDLGLIGCFLIGAYGYASALVLDLPWPLAILVACFFGALGGLLTGYLHFVLKLNSLLAGIVSVFALRTVAARLALTISAMSGGEPTPVIELPTTSGLRVYLWEASSVLNELLGFKKVNPPTSHALLALASLALAAGGLAWLAKSRLGTAIRAVGENRELAFEADLPVRALGVSGLAMAGSLGGGAGAALMFLNTMATLESSHMILVEAFAGYFLGDALALIVAERRQTFANGATFLLAFGGAFTYHYLRTTLQVLAARLDWIEPTDYSLVFSASLIVLSLAIREWLGRAPEAPIKIY